MAVEELHAPCWVTEPKGWVLDVAPTRAVRLAVFVHGFGGKALKTWNNFPSGGLVHDWWRETDMLFVGYDSGRDNITAVADRIRKNLRYFYPLPHPPAMNLGGAAPREDTSTPYEELVVLGHSLGGLVLRRAMADAAQARLDDEAAGAEPRCQEILDAKLRLFSPASAGFRAAGLLGAAQASGLGPALDMYLRRSSAYTDLQPGLEL